MTGIANEVSRRKQIKTETEKRIREMLTFSLASYNLDNFKIIEKTQEFYTNIQKTYEEYASDLISEDKENLSEFDKNVRELLEEVKNISDNVLVETQNALTLAYNEGAYVINGDKEGINYSKVLKNVEESQELLNASATVIGDVVTAMGAFKDAFESEVGLVVVAKITQLCEGLLSTISDTKDSDLVLSLVALKAISEKKG